MIHTVALAASSKILVNASLESISSNDIRWYWVDFDSPTTDEAQLLCTFFHFDELSIEDCLERLERPKVD